MTRKNFWLANVLLFDASGEAFYSFHSTVSACLTTTLILLVSYFFSSKTYGLMRQSVFVSSARILLCCRNFRFFCFSQTQLKLLPQEIFFNSFACFLYITTRWVIKDIQSKCQWHLRFTSFQFLRRVFHQRFSPPSVLLIFLQHGISCYDLCLREWCADINKQHNMSEIYF